MIHRVTYGLWLFLVVSSAGQKNNYSQLLPVWCLSIWKPLRVFMLWVCKRWKVRVGRRAAPAFPRGKGGKAAMPGVGWLPAVQGNQCWCRAGLVAQRLCLREIQQEDSNRHLERFQCCHLQCCSSYTCVLLLWLTQGWWREWRFLCRKQCQTWIVLVQSQQPSPRGVWEGALVELAVMLQLGQRGGCSSWHSVWPRSLSITEIACLLAVQSYCRNRGVGLGTRKQQQHWSFLGL